MDRPTFKTIIISNHNSETTGGGIYVSWLLIIFQLIVTNYENEWSYVLVYKFIYN